MRKFENIKPLNQEPRFKEVPKLQTAWTKLNVINNGEFYQDKTSNIAAVNSAISSYNTAGQAMQDAKARADKWTLWGKAKRKQSYLDSVEDFNKASSNLNSTIQSNNVTDIQGTDLSDKVVIPEPPTVEEVAKQKLAYEASPARAATTQVDGDTFAERQAQRKARRQERNEALQETRNSGEELSAGTKVGAVLKNVGSHIAGAVDGLNQGMKAIGNSKALEVGTAAVSMLNPGPQTDLKSDANINAGLDAAANIAGMMGPYGKIAEFGIKGLQTVGNFVAGNMKPKFSVDKDLQARQRASYMDTFKQVEKLSQGPGIMGIFGGGWRDKWQDAQAQYELTKDIDNRGQDAAAAGRYEGIGLQNEMALNGGYTSLRAAKNGMKINSLKFARKAASGLRFNSFKMQEGEGIDITNKNINPNDLQNKNPEDKLTKAIREAGGINYTDNAGNTHVRVASNLLKTYKPSEIQEWYTKNHPQITVDWNLHSSSGIEDADLLNDEWWDKNKEVILQNANEWWKSEAVKADNSSEIERIVAKMSDLNYQLTPEEENTLTKAGYKKGTDGLWYDPSKLESKKQGGVFTFFPATEDEEIQFFKEGGSFNVIPDGALHKNKHHIEDTEGLTQKGIPVVTEGDEGKLVQQAEIEINEIIFRLEVTNKLEELAKEGTDEAAIEAGKLLVKEILHNTHDNTGLINEISI